MSTAAPHPLPSLFLWTSLVVLLTLLFQWHRAADEPFGYLDRDTAEYAVFAESIRNGTLADRLDPVHSPHGLYLRPPGYPLMLATAQTFFPNSLRDGLQFLHSLLFFCAALLWVYAWRAALHPSVAALSVSIVALTMREAFRSNMAEWTAMCSVVALLATLVLAARSKNDKSATPKASLLMGLACSALLLVKPGYIFILPFLLCMLPSLCGRGTWRSFIVGLLPLIAWVAINFHRTGTIGIGQQGNFAFYYIASLLGPADIRSEDPSELRRCLELINKDRVELANDELIHAKELNPVVDKNNQGIIYDLLDAGTFSWPTLHTCMGTYARRSIDVNFSRYLQHLWYGAQTLRHSLLEAFCLILLIYLLRHTPQARAFITLAGFATLLHLGNVATVIASQVMLPRYFLLSSEGLWLCIVTGVCVWATNILRGTKGS